MTYNAGTVTSTLQLNATSYVQGHAAAQAAIRKSVQANDSLAQSMIKASAASEKATMRKAALSGQLGPMKEKIEKVNSAMNAFAGALGVSSGAVGKFGSAFGNIFGAAASGGVVGVGLAAAGAALALMNDHWGDMDEAAKEAGARAQEVLADLRKEAQGLKDELAALVLGKSARQIQTARELKEAQLAARAAGADLEARGVGSDVEGFYRRLNEQLDSGIEGWAQIWDSAKGEFRDVTDGEAKELITAIEEAFDTGKKATALQEKLNDLDAIEQETKDQAAIDRAVDEANAAEMRTQEKLKEGAKLRAESAALTREFLASTPSTLSQVLSGRENSTNIISATMTEQRDIDRAATADRIQAFKEMTHWNSVAAENARKLGEEQLLVAKAFNDFRNAMKESPLTRASRDFAPDLAGIAGAAVGGQGFSAAGGALMGAGGAALSMALGDPTGAIGGAAGGALGQLLGSVIDQLEPLAEAGQTLLDTYAEIVSTMTPMLEPLHELAVLIGGTVIAAFSDFYDTWFGFLGSVLTLGVEVAAAFAPLLVLGFKLMPTVVLLEAVLPYVTQLFSNLADGISFLADAVGFVYDGLRKAAIAIVDFVNDSTGNSIRTLVDFEHDLRDTLSYDEIRNQQDALAEAVDANTRATDANTRSFNDEFQNMPEGYKVGGGIYDAIETGGGRGIRPGQTHAPVAMTFQGCTFKVETTATSMAKLGRDIMSRASAEGVGLIGMDDDHN